MCSLHFETASLSVRPCLRILDAIPTIGGIITAKNENVSNIGEFMHMKNMKSEMNSSIITSVPVAERLYDFDLP